MKRILALLLAVTMLFSLTACGKKADTTDNTDTGTTTSATAGGDTTSTVATDGTTSAGDTTTSATDTADTSAAGSTSSATTAKPTTTKPQDEQTHIRVLAIGDGTTLDAMESHLYEMFKAAGYQDVRLGLLYTADSTLDAAYTNVKGDKAVYQYRENTSGKWKTTDKCAPSKAFKAADWDYVVLQQSAADSGMPATYGKLGDLLGLVKKQVGDAQIYWHMTWAYQQNSGIAAFANYYYNQISMYQTIINTTLQQVFRHADVWALIPSGTAVQNLRTSSLRDGLTTDGLHLNDYGDYTAALTWYCTLSGEDADTVSYRPSAIADHYDEIVEAVQNAVNLPSKVTNAANGDGEYKSIRILAVGNSFSIDAMHNHLYGLLESAGYDEIRLGILYVGGCSIDMHYNYLKADSASYEYLENIGGKWTNTKEYKASAAFALCDWDFVTVQQVSGYSGLPSSYKNLDALMDLIKGMSGNAKIYWQMTWAYQQNSTHGDFSKYGKDQMKMYNAIVSTVQEKIVGNPDFDGVIPSGTAVQNARTSSIGDTLTADGYHLDDSCGDYTASLTWFCTLTGESAYATYYCPAAVAEHYREIAEAVESAVEKPFAVTEQK